MLEDYIKEYVENRYEKFVSNPLIRIKITHIVAVFLLVVNALVFTDNIVSMVVQFIIAIAVLMHDFDDKYIKNELVKKIDNLKDQQTFLEAIVEQSPEAIIVVDEDYNIITYNQTAQKTFGWEKDEMIGDNNLYKIALNETFENVKDTKKLLVHATTKDNIKIPLDVVVSKISYSNFSLTIGIIKNITKDLEQQKQLNAKNKDEKMGEIIINIAHQWRQPLSAISMIAGASKLNHQLGILSAYELEQSYDDIIEHINYLSQTLEDFKAYYEKN